MCQIKLLYGGVSMTIHIVFFQSSAKFSNIREMTATFEHLILTCLHFREDIMVEIENVKSLIF